MNRFGPAGRTGPAPLSLHLSRELAAVDPASLRVRAGVHAAEAEALTAQAAALRAAVVRLVPAAWTGLGSLSFASAALLQAGALESIAAAATDMGRALTALANGLEAARAEAETVVRAANHFDADVAADDRSRGARPGPERPDLDPAVLDARFAAARALSGRLLVAEESARQAWRQASAVFDLVAYRMPDLAARMNGAVDDGWRPSAGMAAVPAGEWRALVGLSPLCTDGGYAGAGALTGPDGRRYPLVVPWLRPDGTHVPADATGPDDVASLGGADPGWRVLGVRVGIDEFGASADTATKAAIVTAGLAGNAPRMVGRLRPDLLPRLVFSPSGAATIGPAAGAAPAGAVPVPRSGGAGSMPQSALVHDPDARLRWVPDTSKDPAVEGRAVQRQSGPPSSARVAPVAPNVTALAASGLGGLDTARRLDDGRAAAYRVSFEENDDGRTRARMTLYQVRTDGSSTSVLTSNVSVAPDGELRRDPVT